ncbi:hypothetical protein NDU88_000022 [Pleurodeles waltl]|uniref:Uncharacterized protein n=1 Tax=Pleurodeles waltl TaxID=8319 RepID=A0AAV7V4B2_PLEWA|nr:hypothetical protein NDU88_000022 [Pleurodeles waltl]
MMKGASGLSLRSCGVSRKSSAGTPGHDAREGQISVQAADAAVVISAPSCRDVFCSALPGPPASGGR